jgi:hypothetical protein
MARTRNLFYGRYPWKRTRRQVRLAAGFKCSVCGELTPHGLHVHHRKPLKRAAALAYEPQNLMTLCTQCHNAIEPRNGMPQHGCDIDGNPLSEMHPWNVGRGGQNK